LKTQLVVALLGMVAALLAASATVGRAQVTPVPQAPAPWTGALPASGDGIALLVTTRSVTAVDLVSRLQLEGCTVVTLAVIEGGHWLIHVVGAPERVNVDFPATLESTRPFLARCGGPERPLLAGPADDARTLALRVHQRLRLSLPANPSTGFAWRVDPPIAPTVLEQVGEPVFHPDSDLVGAGGTMTFDFLASGPGLVTLRLIYDRSFEADSTQDEWSTTVIVRGQQAVAWFGTITPGPAGGYAFLLDVIDGAAVAMPIVGSDGQTSNALTGLAASGAAVLVSGELTCDAAHPDCQIDAVRIVAADSSAVQPAVPVVGWSGTVHGASGEARESYFQQTGRFPVQYGLQGATPELQMQLDEVRTTGQAIRIWGDLRTSVDDLHGTLIVVTQVSLAPIP
jgi:inhibitor of cysteine peptidase